MKNSVWFSVLGTAVLGSSIGMASSSLPLQPQDCMQTKIRKQVEDGAMQTLIDEGLYRLHEGDEDSPQAKGPVAAQVALGVTQQDVDEKGSLLVRLERGTTQISELDCALHHLSARFAQYQVERRKDMNSIVGMMNKILENDQLIQAFMIAHGSTMLDSFEPDEHETTTYDVLKNRAKVFTDFIRKNDSIFTYPYSGSDLIQQEVQHYFDHSPLVDCICGEKHKEGTLCDKIYKCSTCGSDHLKGALCSNATINEGENSLDLSALNFESYECPCGQTHEYTEQCSQNLPVYLTSVAAQEANQSTTFTTRAVALDDENPQEGGQEEVALEPTRIAGYISQDKFWHKLNSTWSDDTNERYLCSCGQWHTVTSPCNEPVISGTSQAGYYSNGQLYAPCVRPAGEELAPYLCKCGEWHIDASACKEEYEVITLDGKEEEEETPEVVPPTNEEETIPEVPVEEEDKAEQQPTLPTEEEDKIEQSVLPTEEEETTEAPTENTAQPHEEEELPEQGNDAA